MPGVAGVLVREAGGQCENDLAVLLEVAERVIRAHRPVVGPEGHEVGALGAGGDPLLGDAEGAQDP